MKRSWIAAVLLLTAIALDARWTSAQVVREDLWVTDGPITSVARSGNILYLAGAFNRIGPATGSAIGIDPSTGGTLGFPKVVGTVEAIESDGAGGWYLGGQFSQVGGVPRSNLAHIHADHTLSPWSPTVVGAVFAIAASGPTVYLGGNFSNVGGQGRNHIAAVDAATGAVTAWNPNSGDQVLDLLVSGSTVYASGFFKKMGVHTRNLVTAIDASTGVPTSWNAGPYWQSGWHVREMSLSGTTLYAAGWFGNLGRQPRNNVVALDTGTGNATAWNPDLDDVATSIMVNGQTVYVGGSFTHVGGEAASQLVAIDAVTGTVSTMSPEPGYISSIVADGSHILVAGYHGGYGVFAYDAGTQALAWSNPNFNEPVQALAADGSGVYAGGAFTSVGGVLRYRLAAIDAITGEPTSWNPNTTYFALAVAVTGTTVYVAGGSGGLIGGAYRSSVAAIDANTGLASTFNPNPNSYVTELEVGSGPTLYAGGRFTRWGGGFWIRNRAAQCLPTGQATDWDPNAAGNGSLCSVDLIVASGSTIYVAGDFTSIGGQPRNGLAALDAVTGLATDWNPDPNDEVAAIEVDGSTVYVGGQFTQVGGASRPYLAALDASTGLAMPWNPAPSGVVSALDLAESVLYVGGNFTSIAGEPRSRVAAFEGTSGLLTPWSPEILGPPSEPIHAFEVVGSSVIIAGEFAAVDGLPQSNLAAVALATTDVPGPRIPVDMAFERISPNPSAAGARIDYRVGRETRVRVAVIDLQGREVARLVDGLRPAGRHQVAWDGTGATQRSRLAAGVYFVLFQAEGRSISRRWVVIP